MSQTIDRIDFAFDDPNLVANAGLVLVATLTRRLGLEALASLSRRELDVLRLRFAEGHSSAEVAELLGYSSPAVVDVTVSRARKKLEKRLPLSLMSILLGG